MYLKSLSSSLYNLAYVVRIVAEMFVLSWAADLADVDSKAWVINTFATN
jgi:hypothetical protein